MSLKSLLLIAAIGLAWLLLRKALHKLVARIGQERQMGASRIHYVTAVMSITLAAVAIVAAGMVIGIDYDRVGLFVTSAFAVLGVALFAQWSILSNVTASVIIFFFFPYRVGDYVRIIDGDNSIEGSVEEVTLFHVILRDKTARTITYPNAMVFQKAVMITRQSADDETPEDEQNHNW
jgi:small-conductance mechanosensitive channel